MVITFQYCIMMITFTILYTCYDSVLALLTLFSVLYNDDTNLFKPLQTNEALK